MWSDLEEDSSKRKKSNRTKSVAKIADVEVHSRNPLTNIEVMVNQLNSVVMTDTVVVDVWGYDDLVELIVCVIEKILISK